MTRDDDQDYPVEPAEIVREYGPFPGVSKIAGVTHDGQRVWFASGERIHALDPETGTLTRTLEAAAKAGTAFDGRHLFQIADGRISKIDPETGRVLAVIPAPGGNGADSGLAWSDGSLWVGQFADRRIYQIDAETGRLLRTIESNRFVTGVTWADGELWHGTREAGEHAVRCIDPVTGAVRARLDLPDGAEISGLESDGRELLMCGGGSSGTIRAVRRPRRMRRA